MGIRVDIRVEAGVRILQKETWLPKLGLALAIAGGMLPHILTSLREDSSKYVLVFCHLSLHRSSSVVAHFDAEELITQRELFPKQLTLDVMFLMHVTFGKEFTEAVEAKQVAQQEAEIARFEVEKAEWQKEMAIISA
ncbi:hypothetical protein P7K49_017389 [Saguinus oedipus]|uniref:Prohibitin n=1 Tax=Saguinus oedipus TaxID=9490 RepID=A0ABQ9V2C4_SAGOE|nr:hypothetical protein P7K49_017389 [Saguinus oedipus]